MEDRTGNTGKRIEYIDLAKGICILLVVFFHISLHYHPFVTTQENDLTGSVVDYTVNA